MSTEKTKEKKTTNGTIYKLKRSKNMFINRVKTLKRLKANGRKIDIATIQKVFNVEIINVKDKNEKSSLVNKNNATNTKADKKTSVKDKFTKNKNEDTSAENNETIKETENKSTTSTESKGFKFKFPVKSKGKHSIKNKKKYKKENKLTLKDVLKKLYILAISGLISFGLSFVGFIKYDTITFNEVNERFSETISRSIKSPQTELYLKSKYDTKSDATIYYYEIIDNLDSYTYYIRNMDVNDSLRIDLLEKIASNSKTIQSIGNINTGEFNTIVLVDDYYVLNNKYKIHEDNISGKDISLVTSSIKQNNLNNFYKNKMIFTVTWTSVGTVVGYVILSLATKKKSKH
jgi:Rps23 Pro-64 3,4-dihydroxylase Tpa1-like proline 4-hydroxylase